MLLINPRMFLFSERVQFRLKLREIKLSVLNLQVVLSIFLRLSISLSLSRHVLSSIFLMVYLQTILKYYRHFVKVIMFL